MEGHAESHIERGEAPEVTQTPEMDARVFLSCCRAMATSGGDSDFALLLFDYARRPMPAGLDVWLPPLEIASSAPAFRVLHRALHELLVGYVAQKFERLVHQCSQSQWGVQDPDWMAQIASVEATGAFAPFFSPAEAQALWRAVGEAFEKTLGAQFDPDDLRRIILPPSPIPLTWVVDLVTPSKKHPALFAVVLPDGTLQPVGDWIHAHWQDAEQLHALAEQWHAMVSACLSERQEAISLCDPFIIDDWLVRELLSEALRSQLAWFNCTLYGRIPKRLEPQDIVVRCKLGERHPMGTFNAQALLDFSYEVLIHGQPLPEEAMTRLLATEHATLFTLGETLLDPKQTRYLSSQLRALKQLDTATSGKALSLFEGMRLLAGLPVRAFDNDETLTRQVQVSERLAAFLAGGEAQPMPDLPEAMAVQLRPYQREGVRFLWEGSARGLGLCLADDMGLGKTLQVLALLQLWQRTGVLADMPALVIVPPTLLENWRAEQQRWAPELKLKICHPRWMEAAAWAALEEAPGEALRGVEVALFSYQMIPRVPALAQVLFPAIILDEAQAIKTPGSQQSQAVRALRGTRRIILTGTPVENSLLDLWTLFDFLNPGLLGTQERIRQMNRQPDRYMPALRRLVKPFLLRRLKSDPGLLADLPGKDERLVPCPLTPAQALAYRQIVETLRTALQTAQVPFARSGLVLRTLVRLKQLCNHPSQLTHAVDYPPAASGKFLKLLDLAGQILATGEKFLLFTQFYEVIAPLHALLTERLGCPGFILHGRTPVEERKARVAAFQAQPGPAFFIISLRAGGVGLNLTAATHVIHFDRWWNPAVENQASDRAHRIGQQHHVTIHKFICHGTLEERIDALIAQKRALFDELLRAGPEKLLTTMSNDELLALVRLAPTAAEETP